MKILSKVHEFIRQNENNVKKPQKHDANLQKNSTLYFQIGLIMCLLGTYGVLEMKFLAKPIEIPKVVHDNDDSDLFAMTDYKIYEEPIEQKVETKRPEVKPIIDELKVADDDMLIESKALVTPDDRPADPLIDNGKLTIEKPTEPVDVPFVKVEHKPVFPGCEDEITEQAKMECFQEQISKFISRKFNTNVAANYGLTGIQKIDVQFKVSKTGEIIDIKTRAPHPALEKEAQRVINKLPAMKPGYQRDTPVSVIYGFPITFMIMN